MKNKQEKQLRKLLSGVRRVRRRPADGDPIRTLIESIFEADTTPREARAAGEAIVAEFVDYNELRVAPVKDIVECVGRKHPFAREKAESLVRTLNNIFDRQYSLSLEYMADLPRKDLRRHLQEAGMSPYAVSRFLLTRFDESTLPVDQALVDTLKMTGCLPPDDEPADVQGQITKLVGPRMVASAHDFLRKYVEKMAKDLAKKRKAEALAAAKAQAEVLKAQQAAQAAQAAKAAAEAARAAQRAALLEQKAKIRLAREQQQAAMAAAKAAKHKAKPAKKPAKASAAHRHVPHAGGKKKK